METKPYSLQSPEQIAKDYGGNKQRIAEAMQMGIVDPTAGTMAGMFIDRMRAAQQQEMAPQPTVAQQVFAPPAPPMGAAPIPAGLGATPEAAAMAAAAPQMMAPPPPPAPPMGAPGMAAGGLTTLPLPDAMFDEPDVGGYASGGLVAFDRGGAVNPNAPAAATPTEEEEDPNNRDIRVLAPREKPGYNPEYLQGIEFVAPPTLGGFRNTGFDNLDTYAELAPYRTEAAQEFTDYLRSQLSPEARRERQQQDMWSMLGQIGARMASTPGSLLQAVGAGIGEAVPATAAAARERRAEERQLRESILGEERTGNREREARAGVALEMLRNYNSLEQALQDRNFRNLWDSLGRATQIRVAEISGQYGLAGSKTAAAASMYGSDRSYEASMANNAAMRNRAFADFVSSAPGANALGRMIQDGMRPDEALSALSTSFGGAPPPGAVRPRS